MSPGSLMLTGCVCVIGRASTGRRGSCWKEREWPSAMGVMVGSQSKARWSWAQTRNPETTWSRVGAWWRDGLSPLSLHHGPAIRPWRGQRGWRAARSTSVNDGEQIYIDFPPISIGMRIAWEAPKGNFAFPMSMNGRWSWVSHWIIPPSACQSETMVLATTLTAAWLCWETAGVCLSSPGCWARCWHSEVSLLNFDLKMLWID